MPVKYDKRRYRRRNRIEIMFGRLKDSRCVDARIFFAADTFKRSVNKAGATVNAPIAHIQGYAGSLDAKTTPFRRR